MDANDIDFFGAIQMSAGTSYGIWLNWNVSFYQLLYGEIAWNLGLSSALSFALRSLLYIFVLILLPFIPLHNLNCQAAGSLLVLNCNTCFAQLTLFTNIYRNLRVSRRSFLCHCSCSPDISHLPHLALSCVFWLFLYILFLFILSLYNFLSPFFFLLFLFFLFLPSPFSVHFLTSWSWSARVFDFDFRKKKKEKKRGFLGNEILKNARCPRRVAQSSSVGLLLFSPLNTCIPKPNQTIHYTTLELAEYKSYGTM